MIRLRQKEPDLERPFRAIAYPYGAGLALGLSAVCLVALTYYNPGIAALFLGLLSVGLVYFGLWGRNRLKADWTG